MHTHTHTLLVLLRLTGCYEKFYTFATQNTKVRWHDIIDSNEHMGSHQTPHNNTNPLIPPPFVRSPDNLPVNHIHPRYSIQAKGLPYCTTTINFYRIHCVADNIFILYIVDIGIRL